VAGRASDLKKTEWWDAGVVICLEQGADLHLAQLMPLALTVSCFSKIQIGSTFLVLGHILLQRFCTSHHFDPSSSPVVSLSFGILHEWMRTQMLAKPSLNLLQRTGGDHRGGRAQPG